MIAGAVLTLPVLYAVMAHELFKMWVPGALLNHWMQLALITPVMFWTGWPIHRTGWLALAHRSADRTSRPRPPRRRSRDSYRAGDRPGMRHDRGPATAPERRGTGPGIVYFCSAGCAAAYDADPGRHAAAA